MLGLGWQHKVCRVQLIADLVLQTKVRSLLHPIVLSAWLPECHPGSDAVWPACLTVGIEGVMLMQVPLLASLRQFGLYLQQEEAQVCGWHMGTHVTNLNL